MKYILITLILFSSLYSKERFYTDDTAYEKNDIMYDKKTNKPIKGMYSEIDRSCYSIL